MLASLGSYVRRLGCTVTLVATGDKFSFCSGPRGDRRTPARFRRRASCSRRCAQTPPPRAGVVVATWVMGPADVGRSCDAVLPEPFGRRDFDRALNLLRDLEEEK